MRRLTAFFVSILFFFIGAQAQTLSVSGRLQDPETKLGVQGATVVLKSIKDTTLAFSSTSDKTGRFKFAQLAPDAYRLTASSVGYEPLSRTVNVATSSVFLGSLTLPRSTKELKGVTVTGRIPPAQQKGDTIQFNASQFKVNPDASAEDLVRKVPGISVDEGQVKVLGDNVRRVTIDGRELFGEDATAALRNLPAEVIDKIEVFDRLSDQAQLSGFDDGNTMKEINIVTKANMRNGQFGRVYGGYGTNDRYQAGGNTTFLKENRRISVVGNFNNINQQNFAMQDLLGVTSNTRHNSAAARSTRGGATRQGGPMNRTYGSGGNFGSSGNFMVRQQDGLNSTNAAGINYSDLWGKKWTVTGSYLVNNTQNTANQEQQRRYYLPSVASLDEHNNNNSNNYNHRVNMRLEYRISPKQELIITPNLSFQDNHAEHVRYATRFKMFDTTKRIISDVINHRESDRNGNNLNNSVIYRQSFNKKGRTLTAAFNTAYNKRDGETYVVNGTSRYQSDTTEVRRFNDQLSNGLQLSANINYTEPVGERSQLQVNYNPSYTRSRADQQSFRFDTTVAKYSVFDSVLSNRFNNTALAQNAGLAFRYGKKENQVAVGMNYQHTTLNSDQRFPYAFTVDKRFNNLLPNAWFRYKLSPRSNIRLVYRANVDLPSVNQLSEVLDKTNQPFLRIGNAKLVPQYNHVLSSRYTFTNTASGVVVMGNVFAQASKHYISNATYVAQWDSAIGFNRVLRRGEELSVPVNLDGYASLRSFLTLGMPMRFIKSNLNLNGGVSFYRTPGILNDTLFKSNSQVYTLGTVISSNISENVDFTVSYSANMNIVDNGMVSKHENNYFQHVTRAQVNLLSKNGWLFQSDVTNQWYKGLSDSFDQSYWLWNAGLGKKFLKDRKGELRFNVFDVLDQNQSIERTISDVYIEDERNEVLPRYFMLTFTYNLRNFGKAAEPQEKSKAQKWRRTGYKR